MADAGLPGPQSSVASAAALFSARGLNESDMVILLGEIKILIPMLLAKSSNMGDELNVKSGHVKMWTLEFSLRFGWELVVLHTKHSMFGKILVHGWSWCGSLNKKYSTLVHWGSIAFNIFVSRFEITKFCT